MIESRNVCEERKGKQKVMRSTLLEGHAPLRARVSGEETDVVKELIYNGSTVSVDC